MAIKFLRKVSLYSAIGIGGSTALFYSDELKKSAIGGLRFGRAAETVIKIVIDYQRTLYAGKFDSDSVEYKNEKSQVHQRSAEKLLKLCCVNGGAFIKVGQHLGSLEYLLPSEYVNTLKVLHSKAPKSSLESVYEVLRHELKCEPSDIFEAFDPEPLGAASLAQVHRAILKDGRQMAIKVQHPEVLDHSIIDMKGMEILVGIVPYLFPDFKFDWLVNEVKTNLPIELDFRHEGKNAERVAAMFSHFAWLKVPVVDWKLTTNRVLTMEYCMGGQVNDLDYINSNGIDTYDISEKLGKLYAEMIFVNGFIHCDPHPGNIFVSKKGSKLEITLLDHGLYLALPEHFRLMYGKLWQSILNVDLKKIEYYSRELGVGELYGLFACMVTGRSWNSISEGIDKKKITDEEIDSIKLEVAKFLPQISEVLTRVPRQMILIFKTNDCLRGIEFSLKTNRSMKSFISMSRCCIKAVYNQQRKTCTSFICTAKANLGERYALFKVTLYVFFLWIKSTLSFQWFKESAS